MKRIENWQELFNNWQGEADKYTVLNRLRQYYDAELARLMNPFHEEIFRFIERNNPVTVSAEVRDRLFAKVKPFIDELNSWYAQMIQEINRHFQE